VAAIGVPNERLGEEVAVVIHLHRPGSLNMDQLLEYARSKLASYKVPAHVFFSEEALPRNATNKVLKAVLKAKYVSSPVES
jgi:acyl-CoA synthetase (AMP-forming)/AMP-acid ligase II